MAHWQITNSYNYYRKNHMIKAACAIMVYCSIRNISHACLGKAVGGDRRGNSTRGGASTFILRMVGRILKIFPQVTHFNSGAGLLFGMRGRGEV